MSTDISISKQSYRAPIFGTTILGWILSKFTPVFQVANVASLPGTILLPPVHI